jgi:hypothetical protein
VTRADVQGRLIAIAKLAHVDPEAAHLAEMRLWESVLTAIVNGDVEPSKAAGVAEMALKSKELSFPRWFA